MLHQQVKRKKENKKIKTLKSVFFCALKEIVVKSIEVVKIIKSVTAKIFYAKTTGVISSVFAGCVSIKKFRVNAKVRNSYAITTTYSIKKLICHKPSFMALYEY